jgi:hypothetical protein
MTEPTTMTGIGDRDTSQVAREQGQDVKDSARDAASNVAATAGERAHDIKDQAGSHVRGIAGEVGRQLRDRIEQETERAGSALGQAGSQLQALTEGRTDEAGAFAEYAEKAAQALNRWADAIQDRGLDGLVDDLRRFAQRRPGAFLLGTGAAGVIAGRLGRNLRGEMSDSSELRSGNGAYAPASDAFPTSGQTGAGPLATEQTIEIYVDDRSMS